MRIALASFCRRFGIYWFQYLAKQSSSLELEHYERKTEARSFKWQAEYGVIYVNDSVMDIQRQPEQMITIEEVAVGKEDRIDESTLRSRFSAQEALSLPQRVGQSLTQVFYVHMD